MFIFKGLFYFSISFIILSIPIGERPIFSLIHQVSGPFTQRLFQNLKDNLKEGQKLTSTIMKNTTPQTFKKSKPQIDEVDRISTQQSTTHKKSDEIFHESYTEEERDLIKRILKK
jgi:hypothetical protein